MADLRQLMLDIFARDQGASRTLGKVADAADDTGTAFSQAARDAERLDQEIDDLQGSLRGLAAEFARTGDKDLFRDMRRQQGELRQLMNVRGLMGDVGGDGAEGFAAGFSQRIGPLMMRAPLSPPIAAAIVAGAPLIASAVAGAVTLGVGGGAVAAGLAIAAKDPRVQAAGKVVGGEFAAALASDAAVFVPETMKALSFIRGEFQSWRPLLRDVFNDASEYVEPLTRGVAGFGREIGPGIRDAVRNAEPLVEMMEVHIPRAGAVIGGMLRDLSQSSKDSANTISGVLTLLEGTLFTVGKTVSLLSSYGKFIGLGPLQIFGELMGKGDQSTMGWVDSLSAWANTATAAGVAAETTAEKNQRLIESLEGIEDAATSARRAEMDFAAALDELKASIDENGTSLDVGSEKGRANLRVLEDLISAADRAGDAAESRALAEGASAERAAVAGARIRETWINDLVAAATAAGLSKRKIDEMVAAARKADETRIRIYYDQIFRMFGRPFSDVTGIGGSGFRGYARGGMIEGSGPRGVDSVPILGAPGEGVLNLQGMAAVGGKAGLDALNSGRAPMATAGYAGGGWSGPTGPMQLVMSMPGGASHGLGAAFSTWFHESLRVGDIQLAVKIGDTTHRVTVG